MVVEQILIQADSASVCRVCSCSNDVMLTFFSFSFSKKQRHFDKLQFRFISESMLWLRRIVLVHFGDVDTLRNLGFSSFRKQRHVDEL